MPSEKCVQCGKSVYVVEKLAILDQVFHKWCFKCQVCSTTLTMKNYSAVGGKPYCKAHYPMPTATGATQEAVASVGYNTPQASATAQSTESNPVDSSYGQDQYYGGGEQQYDDQQQYGEQAYDDGQQYEQ